MRRSRQTELICPSLGVTAYFPRQAACRELLEHAGHLGGHGCRRVWRHDCHRDVVRASVRLSRLDVVSRTPLEYAELHERRRQKKLESGILMAFDKRHFRQLNPFSKSVRAPVSGGQTGADRAALDFAIDRGFE